MRCVLVILDGLADEPAPCLGGRTPLEAAHTPHLDRLAAVGRAGRFLPTHPGRAPGSEVGVPACLGHDPGSLPPARARLEAAGRGIPLKATDAVFRATCVHVSGRPGDRDERLRGMADPAATWDAVRSLVPGLEARGVRLYPDPHGRHLAVLPDAPNTDTVPPHELAGLPLSAGGTPPRPDAWAWARKHLPGGLALWPWGGAGEPLGRRNKTPFGALVTGVDLVRGIGRALGLETPRVPGATGDVDTDLHAKARAARAALAEHAMVAVHVEAPDMAAHRRDAAGKAAMIERIDHELIGSLLDGPPGLRMAVTADHGTSSRTGRHLGDAVPFLVAEIAGTPSGAAPAFGEAAVADRPVLGVGAWRALLAAEAVPC